MGKLGRAWVGAWVGDVVGVRLLHVNETGLHDTAAEVLAVYILVAHLCLALCLNGHEEKK